MDDIIVRIIDLPWSIKGVTVVDENGDYNLYLNSRYTYEAQLTAYHHESRHINRNHFYDDNPVAVDEADAMKYSYGKRK